MSTPYWGQLPGPKTGQTRNRRLSDDVTPGPDRRQSLDVPAQGQPRSNRVSVQTTKSDAHTESTLSPFASPTASSFQGQGLAPRPPSLPYGTNQYPPELIENRRRRRSRNQEQDNEYASAAASGPPPPAAPEVPRAPPVSYKYSSRSGGPPRPVERMAPEEFYQSPTSADQTENLPILDRARETLDASGALRPQRILTDPMAARNAAGRSDANGPQRRATGTEQPLQRSRRSSMSQSADRPKKFADDRSPLQRLELTLDSIAKESKDEKRARLEAAERIARERAERSGSSQQAEKSPTAGQQVRFRERRGSTAAQQERPQLQTPVTPTRPVQNVAAQRGPLSQNPPEEGLNYGVNGGKSPTTHAPESRIPLPVGAQSSGIPQRNLSFRERAAKNESKLPNGYDSSSAQGTIPPITRGGTNKLKKNAPDPWPRRSQEVEEMYAEEELKTGSRGGEDSRYAAHDTSRAGPDSTRNGTFAPTQHTQPSGHMDAFDDYRHRDGTSTPPMISGLAKTGSQGKADQILGRTAMHHGVTQHLTSNAARRSPVPRKPSSPPVAPVRSPLATMNVAPQYDLDRAARSDSDSDVPTQPAQQVHHHRHLAEFIRHARGDKLEPGMGLFKPSPYLDEWKTATVGTLSGSLLDLEDIPPAVEKGTPWWESPPHKRRTSISSRPKKAEAFEGEYDDTNGMHFSKNQWNGCGDGTDLSYESDGQQLATNDGTVEAPFEPQHLVNRMKKGKAKSKRREGLQSISPAPYAYGSRSRSCCFSLCSDDTIPSCSVPCSPKTNPVVSLSDSHLPKSNALTRPTRDSRGSSLAAPTRFKPPLYLKCGPLLRYCGIRHERVPSRSTRNGNVVDKEIWRGSVMIVTTDADSSYDIAPTLRLFVQPLELLPPPPREISGDEPLAPEYVDPIAGHPKLGRKGETLYVRPVDHLEECRDLSLDETDDGLYEKARSPPDFPLPQGVTDAPGSFAARRKRAEIDGEKAGKYKDVRGFRLHTERGYTFWRFNIEVELREKQQRIAYRINRGPATGFWVPGKGQSMNIMFYSCNGFSMSVNTDEFCGPDPMWRDVLNTHQSQPFHVMIGGGDQIYNDRCMQETKHFKEWLMLKNPLHKHNAPFTAEMQDELETFYLERYAMWFSQGLYGMANSQIPMVNMFDDHDIIDGFGSYPSHFMKSPVFSGIGNVAFKYYMLFQHQSVVEETEKTEPSWTLGLKPGPFINEVSRSLFMFLGSKVALLAVDARTERTRDEVIREDTWKKIMDRCYGELEKGKVEHLLVLLGVPIAYPRLVWLENILTSRLMDPVKALGKTGMFKNILNSFDGGVEVLDDLDDHWTAKNHKHERSIVIEDLQDLAADKSIRVSILSGDVHLAAIGQFYSNPKMGLAKHKDFRYMPNIISSAIVNTPPPDLMADILNKRNKVHHFDKDTDEDMIPIFGHGVDGKPRNNKHLLPHRNWCSIREYVPGNTPPATPAGSIYDFGPERRGSGLGGLARRLSSRSKDKGPSFRGPDGIPRDRTRPPISGGILRTLSRRRGAASADEIGNPPPRPGFLKRTLSGSSVGGRIGGLFRRRSSTTQRDDGGINGNWGADTDEEAYYNEQAPRPRGGAAPGHGMGLRGGLSHHGNNSEFEDGDDSYFSVKPGDQMTKEPAYMTGAAGGSGPESAGADVYHTPPTSLPQGQGAPVGMTRAAAGGSRGDVAPEQDFVPKPIMRAPTGLSTKQMKHAEQLAVNLEGGLEICLNMEISQKDPGGSTVPYRLVVPRLWYEYEGEDPDSLASSRRNSSEAGALGAPDSVDGDDYPNDHKIGPTTPTKAAGGGIKRFISLRKA